MLTLISHMFSAYLKNKSLSIVFLFIVSITTYADSSTQKRIVILSPNLVEISHMIIEKSKTKDIIIVGIIHYPGEPSYAKNIDGIGTSSNINVEKILLLKPNIVLASAGNNSLSLQQIKSFNVKVDIYNTQSLAGIAKLILQVGNSLHLETTSAIISNNYLLQLKSYRKKFHLDKKIKTFIQLSELPIFAVGGDGVINEIIELCGGKNIFWNIKKLAFQAGKSSVLNKDPELIIELFDTLPMNINYDRDTNSQWQSWSNLSAVRANMVYKVNPNLISQNTPKILKGIKSICNIMQNK